LDTRYNSYNIIRPHKGLVAFFLLFSFLLWAEEFTGQVIIEKTSFHVNEEFRFTILIPDIPPARLIIEAPAFPSGLEVVAGPSIRPRINGSVVDYTFRLNNPGRYIIESFRIRSSGRAPVYTPPVFITAVPTSQRHGSIDRIPLSARWDIPRRNYYPGEIIPLRFIIENIENPNITIESEVSQTSGGIVKRISRNAEKNERTVIAKETMTGRVYDVLFHDHIFVPFRAGSLTLPNVEIFISEEDFEYSTILKGVPIAISSLPATEQNISAIGNFSYEYEISGNEISAVQAVILRQKITGTGNFYGITMPVPYICSPEIAFISLIRDRYDVTPDYRFFRGTRELTYLIRKKPGAEWQETISVIIPDFLWYPKDSPESLLHSRQERRQGAVFVLNIEKELFTQPAPDIIQADREEKIKKILFEIFRIILIISIIPSLVFVLKKKNKKSIIALLVIVLLSVIIGFFIITKILIKEPVYGIVIEDSVSVNVYVLPEEFVNVRFTMESGGLVRIIGEKGEFFLIETTDKANRGWIRKENILTEPE